MSEPIKLPLLPDTEYTLAVPAAPYEPAWISSMDAWDKSAMETYARLAVEQHTEALRAECEALRADAEKAKFELVEQVRCFREEAAGEQVVFDTIVAERNALRAECEALRAERNHSRACLERASALIHGIYALLYPPHVKLPDGRTMAFRPSSLDPHEVLQELSDRIRELPDELDALKEAK